MLKQSKKRISRIRNLIVVCSLTAIILVVSTYAWFIGTRTVNVSSFDIQIATTDDLLLSLDGDKWDTTVSISQKTLDEVSYANHTNSWGGRGLIPMSSIGEMDSEASRMKLFEKASLTATHGGYRLMASRVHNYEPSNPEQSGYVAFDLFVKNSTGPQYIEELNELDEEAIYLTVDSTVKVTANGLEAGCEEGEECEIGGVPNTGIENSVRVAFAQIGRVAGTTTDATTITGITCNPAAESKVTGICRTAQIWEPNDTDHVANAISWYETSCLARSGELVTDKLSYEGDCGQVIDGIAYPTYAVKKDIASDDNIDVYDGKAYNTYEDSSESLSAYPYFTDTDKLKTGTARPQFMTLAPNSITKVRVYIYIEGQDIDNYDFASIGRKISVQFGFTKERFTEKDINYEENEGPDVNQGEGPDGQDKTAPVIKLIGDNPLIVQLNEEFDDPGATATDNIDEAEAITAKIVATGTVNTKVPNEYRITYTVKDEAGNTGTATRKVIVSDSSNQG